MSTLKTNNIEHLDATSPSIEVNAAGGIQVGGALTATTGTFSGNVSVAGVLSYEDVANIDSVGIITAQAGVIVGADPADSGSSNPQGINLNTNGYAVIRRSGGLKGLFLGPSGSSSYNVRIGTGGEANFLGQVGIATDLSTSLAHPNMDDLQVGTHSGNRGITIVSGSSNFGSLCFGDSPDASGADRYAGFVEYYHQEDSMRLGTSGGEKLRITSAGNIGINRTDPDQKLNVSGNIELNAYDSTSGSGGYYTSKGLIIGNLYDAGKSYTGSDDRTSCIWQERGLDLDFATNDSLKLKLSVDGRLILGSTGRASIVTDPYFQIEGVAANNASMSIIRNSGANPPYLQLAATGGSALGSLTATPADGYLGQIVFGGSNGTQLRPGVYITCQNDRNTAWTSTSCPTNIVIATTQANQTSPTSRFMIDDLGRIDTFGTNPNAFDIHTSFTGTQVAFAVKQGATDLDSGTITCTIDADGDVKNLSNSYGPITSDERMKQDIVDAGSQWDDIKNIRLTKFRFRNDPTGELQLGPISQELQVVSPGLIKSRPATDEEIEDTTNDLVEGDEVLTFKASILYMKAVKALQEAMAKIETLEAKVQALEES